MKKLLTIAAFGLLAVACVPHDEEVVVVEPENEPVRWQPVQTQPVQPVAVRTVQVQQTEQKQTWWNENKNNHVVRVKVPTCPCADPNDPCPQCYDK